MPIAEMMLAEFEQEAQTTRKFLERLPEEKLTWKPHEKSMTAGQLALHIAGTPAQVLEMGVPDFVPMPNPSNPQPESVAEVLAAHDYSVEHVRKVLPTITDERMQQTWSIRHEGQDLMAMPRMGFLRSILLNHWYHHRGQFGVYLRLMGCLVPSSYGPSGDEMPDFFKDMPKPS